MNEAVQVLWFTQERKDSEETELLIGVYRTQDDANAAIERLKGKPGFVDFPQGFLAEAYELNKDHWTQGFVRQTPTASTLPNPTILSRDTMNNCVSSGLNNAKQEKEIRR